MSVILNALLNNLSLQLAITLACASRIAFAVHDKREITKAARAKATLVKAVAEIEMEREAQLRNNTHQKATPPKDQKPKECTAKKLTSLNAPTYDLFSRNNIHPHLSEKESGGYVTSPSCSTDSSAAAGCDCG